MAATASGAAASHGAAAMAGGGASVQRVGGSGGMLEVLSRGLEGGTSRWLVGAALFLVGIGVRKIIASYTELPTFPIIIALVGVAVYLQYRNKKRAASTDDELRALMLQRQNLLRGHEETVAEAQAGIAAVDTARAGARAASLRQRGKHATVSAAQASLGERSRASQRAGVDSVWRDGDSLGGTVPPRPMRESFKGDANWFSGRSAGDRGTIDIGSLDDADMREPSTSSSSVPRRVAKPAAVPDNVRLTESGRRVYLGRTKERLARLKKRNDQRITAKRERAAVTVPTDGADETKAGSGSGGEVERDGVRDKREGAAPGADGGETASPKPAVAAVGPVQAGRGDDDHRRGAVTRGGTDIHTFLSSVGMTQYTAALEAEALVDVNLLTDMAADPRGLRDALREAGVAKVGHREKIALALQQRHEAAEKRRAKQRGADDSE